MPEGDDTVPLDIRLPPRVMRALKREVDATPGSTDLEWFAAEIIEASLEERGWMLGDEGES